MSIYFPDILENANPQYPLLNSRYFKGTAYPIGQLSETGSIFMLTRQQVGIVVFVSSSQNYYGYYGQTTSSADWNNPTNWKLMSNAENSATASYVTSSNVHGPHGPNSILSSSYAVTSSYALSSSYAVTASFAANSSNIQGGTDGYIPVWSGSTALSSSAIYQTGSDILIGTTNYDYYTLDVSGSARVLTNFVVGPVYTGSILVDKAFGIRLNTPMSGSSNVFGILADGEIQSGSTSNAYYFRSFAKFSTSNSTLSNAHHFTATQTASLGTGTTIENQYGFHASFTLAGAQRNYGFYGNVPASSSAGLPANWNLWMLGTAPNYMAGGLYLGPITSSVGYSLYAAPSISGSILASGSTVISGSLTVVLGSSVEFQVLGIGVKIGNDVADRHTVTGSLNISGSVNVTGSFGIDDLTVRGNLIVSGNTTIGDVATDRITMNAATMSIGNSSGILNIDSNTLYVDGTNNVVGIGRIPQAGIALDITGDVRSSGTFFGQRIATNAIQTYNNLNTTFQTASNNAVVATMFSSSGNFVFQSAQGATDLGYRVAVNEPGTVGSLYVSGSALVNGILTVSSSTDSQVLLSFARGTINGINFQNAGAGTSRVQMRGYSASVETVRIDPLVGSFFNSLTVTGSFTVASGSTEFQVLGTGIKIGNDISDAHTVTGSINISGSLNAPIITGSLFGTASWARNSITASYALNAGNTFTLSNGNGTTANGTAVDLGGTLSSNVFIDGGLSNYNIELGAPISYLGTFKVTATNGRQYTIDGTGHVLGGDVAITGSLRVSGSITGSLFGTASWARNSITASYITGSIFTSANPALSASYAVTASYVTASNVYGPYGSNSVISSSYAANAASAQSYNPYYISAYSTSSQDLATANTYQAVAQLQIENSLGITYNSSDGFYIPAPGVYKIDLSLTVGVSATDTIVTGVQARPGSYAGWSDIPLLYRIHEINTADGAVATINYSRVSNMDGPRYYRFVWKGYFDVSSGTTLIGSGSAASSLTGLYTSDYTYPSAVISITQVANNYYPIT